MYSQSAEKQQCFDLGQQNLFTMGDVYKCVVQEYLEKHDIFIEETKTGYFTDVWWCRTPRPGGQSGVHTGLGEFPPTCSLFLPVYM